MSHTHDLKIRLEYFEAIVHGDKTFEVRFNDRNYKKHDILHLQEHDGENYTGRELSVEVTCLLDNPGYCKEGYVNKAPTLTINQHEEQVTHNHYCHYSPKCSVCGIGEQCP